LALRLQVTASAFFALKALHASRPRTPTPYLSGTMPITPSIAFAAASSMRSGAAPSTGCLRIAPYTMPGT
jgi:hypothetical protein